MTAPLDRGRASFDRRAWADAYEQLSAADRQTPLEAPDLERLGTAAYLLGRDAESTDLWTRAHSEYVAHGETSRAARAAFWLGFGLMNRGQFAKGNGWLARARRLLDDDGLDCVEHGYLLLPEALQHLNQRDLHGAYTLFSRAVEIGDRFGDRDLTTLARHGQGRVLIGWEEIARGVSLLDEVMIAASSGEVNPVIVGIVYCSVISACYEMFDLRRAQEWTDALSAWCASQPDLVPYRGQCLVRRAEIMRLHGAWEDAMAEAVRARDRLSQPPGQEGLGAAYYQQGELHRLRGDFQKAEDAYRMASQYGRKPEPGLALLRRAQGLLEAAVAAIRRVVGETQDRRQRCHALAADVEIMLAVGDAPAARGAADELATIAAALDMPFLRAVSTEASGNVLLAEGDARSALTMLRSSWSAWKELGAPYEVARVRVSVGLACRRLGDEDAAALELDAARQVFEGLGAAPDLARVSQLAQPAATPPAGLTAREVQVLRLVATGKTNRAIADELSISQKTVARHLSNIFTKLSLSSRAAATAYAYEHHLLERST